MTYLAATLAVIALALSFNSLVWSTAAGWYTTTARLWHIDSDRAKARMASKPWHVRYTDWTLRKRP